ncbi:MAG: endonuclease MutS2 [Bacteroidota bacterium]
MKLYHPNTYEKLGFDVILQETAKSLSNQEAVDRCMGIVPTHDPEELIPELKRVKEFHEILEFDEPFPANHFISLEQIIKRLEVEGDWLNARQLNQLVNWLKAVRDVRKYLKSREELYPLMAELANELPFSHVLINEIDRILDKFGNVADDATPELASVRRKLKKSSDSLRNTLTSILKKAIENNWSQDKEITIRNDRLVIPVKAESRRHIKGFVHDMSQSGNTVYIEPTEALTLNNELRELQIREHNEVVKILQDVTAKVSEQLPEIQSFREVMIKIDLVRAKAKLAVKLEANLPVINPKGEKLSYREAYYPLLQLKALQEKISVVPLNLTLEKGRRIVVISGPNAGGKSVSLKSVGLLQLMLQSGFLIPVNEGSEFRLFDSMFLDIGDEQSIESDLSTYTSRLAQWREMGDNMTSNSLFCVDEFGSGTDPKQGGSIAESFLERFVRQGAYGIITTHYGNLKNFAEITKGVINAAMQFDTAELKPTYILMEGVPGRSYAFEMAQRVGVHATILRRARKKVGTEEIDVEKLLKELEKKNNELKKALQTAKQKENQLEQLVEKNKRIEQSLNENRKEIITKAKAEAKDMIQNANRQIEQTIREIRESQAEKERTKELRKALKEKMPRVREEDLIAIKEGQPKKKKKNQASTRKKEETGPVILADREFKEGDWVKLKSSTTVAQLVSLQGKKAVIETDGLRINVKLAQLDKIKPPKEKKSRSASYTVIESGPQPVAKMEIDVMGKRAEEAIKLVDKFVENGRMAGFERLRVLHGKGTGALRESIRNHLSGFPFVRKLSDASVEEGGAGWTIIELRD